MGHYLQLIRDIVTRDMGADFVRSLSIACGWAYSTLYESLNQDTGLSSAMRLEQFGLRRGAAITKAMVEVSRQHGVPYNFRTLGCNGQAKLFVKAGRVVLIQEPMLSLRDQPRTSDYKSQLADTHSMIRQLELELGDQPHRITDWSGSVLAVVLHGASGRRFSRDDRALGGLILGVPNSAYDDWVMRLNLHDLAMFGSATRSADPLPVVDQSDLVNVRRRRGQLTGTEE